MFYRWWCWRLHKQSEAKDNWEVCNTQNFVLNYNLQHAAKLFYTPYFACVSYVDVRVIILGDSLVLVVPFYKGNFKVLPHVVTWDKLKQQLIDLVSQKQETLVWFLWFLLTSSPRIRFHCESYFTGCWIMPAAVRYRFKALSWCCKKKYNGWKPCEWVAAFVYIHRK